MTLKQEETRCFVNIRHVQFATLQLFNEVLISIYLHNELNRQWITVRHVQSLIQRVQRTIKRVLAYRLLSCDFPSHFWLNFN